MFPRPGVEINRYPDPGADPLRKRIRTVFGVPVESEIILGNGSDELIQMLAILVGGPGRTFLAPSPSFSMYEMISLFTGTGFSAVPLGPDFSLDREATLSAIRETRPACIFLAYPNNPTGNSFDESLIEEIIGESDGLVIVDEAYFSFSGRTFLDRLPRTPNLLVMRTLSKSGLAGLRLGILAGHPDWIAELDKVRLPYNINCLTQAGASFCLDHYEVLEAQGMKIREDRAKLLGQLDVMAGVDAYPSDANFILVRFAMDTEAVFAGLKQRGILVKNLHQPGGPLENCLRLTVGTPDDNAAMVEALGDIIKDRAA
jgi:histidinol-phosphate aminotransferase